MSAPVVDAAGVGQVEVEDDGVRRFVLRHYAYDPVRRERRHQVLAAFDTARELEQLLEQLGEDLERRRSAGDDVDPSEHYSGIVMEPGHLRRAAHGHLVKRALAHGVWPSALQHLELPSNMAVFTADPPDEPQRQGSG